MKRMSAARHKNQRQSDSQRYAPFVLLAGAQTLTQKVLLSGCACAGRYALLEKIEKIWKQLFT
ncbi:hypothetical protein Q2E61_11620 [Microbulbifer thermotolerans]|uniref:hypothetical protein n=1 Tax=Microbulbifer thermotolerans TaxID=252514 RepID=UPI0026732908|nr:hypothetical protein [Microbulbifer thermotolerans]WKT59543.1 hypothetical protein Q2E61_11620 [Microbulbifer thermotolerans]